MFFCFTDRITKKKFIIPRLKYQHKEMTTAITKFFITLRSSLKLYHWNTLSYPRHVASDALIGKIDTLSDQFVEVYIGRYGRERQSAKKSKDDMDISLPRLPEDDIVGYLEEARDWLTNRLSGMLKKNDTELFNIRDEIIGEINQCLYLFTLK